MYNINNVINDVDDDRVVCNYFGIDEERINDINEMIDIIDMCDDILYCKENEDIIKKMDKVVEINGYRYKIDIELIED